MRVRRLIVLLVAVGIVAAIAISLVSNHAVNEIRQVVQKGQFGPETAVDLSLKGVELLQGEHGAELWKLNAKGAWYDQQGGVIQVSHPELTYYLKPDGQQLLVRSGRGVIDQQTRIARLWENVEIERKGGYIRSDLLVFNGTSHTLNMIGEVHFDGPDLFGVATNVTWFLDDNIVRAEQGVSIEMLVHSQLDDLVNGGTNNESR